MSGFRRFTVFVKSSSVTMVNLTNTYHKNSSQNQYLSTLYKFILFRNRSLTRSDIGGDRITDLLSGYIAEEFNRKYKADPRETKRGSTSF